MRAAPHCLSQHTAGMAGAGPVPGSAVRLPACARPDVLACMKISRPLSTPFLRRSSSALAVAAALASRLARCHVRKVCGASAHASGGRHGTAQPAAAPCSLTSCSPRAALSRPMHLTDPRTARPAATPHLLGHGRARLHFGALLLDGLRDVLRVARLLRRGQKAATEAHAATDVVSRARVAASVGVSRRASAGVRAGRVCAVAWSLQRRPL
jgi:hypothetical protein